MGSELLGGAIMTIAVFGLVLATRALSQKRRVWLIGSKKTSISVIGLAFVSLSWLILGVILAFIASLNSQQRLWMFGLTGALALIGMACNLVLTGQLKLRSGARQFAKQENQK